MRKDFIEQLSKRAARLSFSSLRVRLLLLVLFALFPGFGLVFFDLIEHQQQAVTGAKADTLQLARLVATELKQEIVSAHGQLITLAQVPIVRRPAWVRLCRETFANLLKQQPRYAQIGVLDLNGDLRCSALPFKGRINAADRTYFRRALETTDFAVGEFQIGRVSGKGSIHLGYPVRDETGQPQAVVFVALDLAALLPDLIKNIPRLKGRAFVVVNDQGTVLARHPESDWVGKALPNSPLITAILAQRREGEANVVGLDGVMRLHTFTPLLQAPPPSGAYVSVGVPEADVLAPARHEFIQKLVLLLLIAAAALAVAWVGGRVIFLQPINALIDAVAGLGRGNLSARTGLVHTAGELGQLAHSFDEMADSLEQGDKQLRASEAERQQADEALRAAHTRLEHLLAVNPAVIYSAHASGDYGATFVSPNITTQLGYNARDFTENPGFWLDHVHPDDRERVLGAFAKLFARGQALVEYRFRRQDGDYRWIRDEMRLVRDAAGKPVEIVGAWLDITERRELEAQQHLLVGALEAAANAMVITDHEGRITWVNPAFTRLTGFSSEEALGANPRLLKSGMQDRSFYADLWQTILAGKVWHGELINRRKDGTLYTEDQTITPVRDRGDGGVTHFIAIKQDITERKRVQEELREREHSLNTLMSNLPGMAYRCRNDPNWTMEFVSEGCNELTGYRADDLLYNTKISYADLIHPNDREYVWDTVQQALGERSAYQLVYRIRTLQGNEKWVWEQGCGTFSDSQLICLEGLIIDITERKRAETKLQESESRFRDLIESTSDWVWEIDQNFVYTYVSPKIKELLGYEPEEMVGKTPFALMPPKETERIAAEFGLVAEVRKPFAALENINLRKDGQMVVLETSAVPIFDADGQYRGYRGIDRDITERKKAENQIQMLNAELEQRVIDRTVQLTAANKELEAFSYSVSHDLRAPLRAIDGFSQALLGDYADKLDDQGRDYLKRVRAATQRMGHLIDDLIELARVTRVDMHRESVDISALAGDVLAALQKSEPDRQVEWHIEPDLTAAGDVRLLRVMLENLLGNAWKFTAKTANARIEFGAGHGEDGVQSYFVRDNGAGFDMTYADKLFSAFQRLHTPNEFPGTGVGLATVQRIIHRHGGRVWAEGAVGKGATFNFTV